MTRDRRWLLFLRSQRSLASTRLLPLEFLIEFNEEEDVTESLLFLLLENRVQCSVYIESWLTPGLHMRNTVTIKPK